LVDCQTACCNVWRFTVLVTDGIGTVLVTNGIHTNYCQVQVNLTVTSNITATGVTAAVQYVGRLQIVCINCISAAQCGQ
jgi:hypothetical protein